MIGLLICVVLVVIFSLVGDGSGIAYFLGGGRAATWGINLAIFAVALGIAGQVVKQRWDGVLIDRDCRISLSRFQLILWTWLLVSAVMTVGLTNATARGTYVPPASPAGVEKPREPQGPLDITIPAEIWALLGLGALTAVSAPGIKETRRQAMRRATAAQFDEQRAIDAIQENQGLKVAPSYEGDVLVKASPNDARWRDLIVGDYQGAPFVDVSKLQQLAFTVLIAVVYAAAIWKMLDLPIPYDAKHIPRVVPIYFFPVASWGVVSLLGISHAAYLTDKQFGDT